MKSWDYKEVTNEAEHRIQQLLEASRGKPAEEAERLRQFAHGVYVLWDGLTLGWRPSGLDDGTRLLNLLGSYQFTWRTELGLPADA
ncbi:MULTISPECIES: hypothetical protein [unclassified Cupriavidus]|jgi:hypothetical protein|uniref:hypothetical protein n=1 Tax=unclassified Cupriavidus TaxID=2640874 RepID=UPI0010F467AC|nr:MULTISPECIES: hypothetical protein [unclassified Cupriavidus]QWE98113.1 hypothetical protein KLP38_30040 [Cupriavidus sp. EM10]